MDLNNSKRILYRTSYVSPRITPTEQVQIEARPGAGFEKAFVMRSLELNGRDVERLRASIHITEFESDEQRRLLTVAEKIAGAPTVNSMALATELAPISYDAVMKFAKLASSTKELSILPLLLDLVNQRRTVSPVGWLHLERIEMVPASVERGELMFTVPMAPNETIMISHKEWSVSSRTYEEVAQDYFESYSERGVTEKSDASSSSDNESRRSNAINFGAITSGTYLGVSVTTTLGLTSMREERESAKQSAQQSREITEKASARVRREHKVSVKIETKTGVEDRSAKTFTNASNNAVRIDYYRMMRKWKTNLLRYGLRLTYDIAVPLPGVRLWAMHQRLSALDKQLQQAPMFELSLDGLTDDNWAKAATELGVPPAVVPLPPPKTVKQVLSADLPWVNTADSGIDRFGRMEFAIPAGYWLTGAKARALYSAAQHPGGAHFTWYNGDSNLVPGQTIVEGNLSDLSNPLGPHPTGNAAVTYSYSGIHTAGLILELIYERTQDAELAWKRNAWAAIKEAWDAADNQRRAALQEERDTLWRLLNGKDTLSFRRLEREELVRLLMQWLLGPDVAVIADRDRGPTTLGTLLNNEVLFQDALVEPAMPSYNPTFSRSNTVAFGKKFISLSDQQWYGALLFGDLVKFVHQAIEWENILYFLYPYFWGSEAIGREKLLFEHSDPEHERFLRAGYARVLLPVRPGFEKDFTRLMETGALSSHATHPYMTVADDIKAFARTNYEGLPPANPELHARPLLFPEQRATWDRMQALMKKIDEYEANVGTYPKKLTDLQGTAADELVDWWGNPFTYRLPGLGADYDLVSLGKDGQEGGEELDALNADISSAAGASLVATWFDYTPTSALDIQVNTAPGDIA